MEPPNDDRETIVFRFGVPKNTPDVPIPFHGDVADAIKLIAEIGNAALLAMLLKMVLKDRITDDKIQLICDVFYHD